MATIHFPGVFHVKIESKQASYVSCAIRWNILLNSVHFGADISGTTFPRTDVRSRRSEIPSA